MTFQELMTLVQDHIPVKIALFDNKKLGMIRQWQEIIYAGNYHSAHLLGPDFAKLADAFGVPAFRARTPDEVDVAITAAQAVDGPALIWFEIAEEQNILPDDAGRQGPVRPDREVGRGGRMSADPAVERTAAAAPSRPRCRHMLMAHLRPARSPAAARRAGTCSWRSCSTSRASSTASPA